MVDIWLVGGPAGHGLGLPLEREIPSIRFPFSVPTVEIAEPGEPVTRLKTAVFVRTGEVDSRGRPVYGFKG